MGKSSAESVKATHQFPLPNTKLVAPKLFLVSLPPPPQFSSGATALCEDQWKETGSERWGQNWEFIPKLDCPELLRPDREPGPRLSDPSTLVEFGFNSSVNQRAAASFRLTARAGHSMTESPPPCCPRSATAAGLACASVAAEA